MNGSASFLPALPSALRHACRRHDVALTPHVLVVTVTRQEMRWFRRCASAPTAAGSFSPSVPRDTGTSHQPFRRFVASTSRFGIGQVRDTRRTPLGLHRIARKIGGGWPVGTVFRAREVTGFTWAGLFEATIAHRILWLEGLEPGFNRGGEVDTFARYIYIHGLADEPTLGRPASHGCVHLAASDLLPLFDRVPSGTLVWIQA